MRYLTHYFLLMFLVSTLVSFRGFAAIENENLLFVRCLKSGSSIGHAALQEQRTKNFPFMNGKFQYAIEVYNTMNAEGGAKYLSIKAVSTENDHSSSHLRVTSSSRLISGLFHCTRCVLTTAWCSTTLGRRAPLPKYRGSSHLTDGFNSLLVTFSPKKVFIELL